MTDRTQKVLEIYRNSVVMHTEFTGYCFHNNENNYSIYINFLELVATQDFCRAGEVISSYWINQDHPEIVKIRKRLDFLNKL